MHSMLKPEDPFHFSHYIGVHAHTLHIEDLIHMVNLDKIFPNVFTVDSHDN